MDDHLNSNIEKPYLNEPFHPRIKIPNIFEVIVFFGGGNLNKIRAPLKKKAHTH